MFISAINSLFVLVYSTNNIVFVVIISPGILSWAFEGLHATSCLSLLRLSDIGRELQIPDLFVSLFEGVSDSNLSANAAGGVALDVQ